ncbi:hypothetical protein AA12717_3341 [Gluconacetobacter sacchari DSM 12717]|uniref:Uncharacterized protein n=2 Tax=Gluconacetobacter sacchari TaxID=92759 RepID=A0A7W4IEH3_9PROT|nr:hypothetical protein [Gluconacetobacter sacchari]MBB2161376.1 hypothetical protein [Gluconacetobacter sacchari]GBQ29694.1 hypothetical protein AA12717_3341 [Gluconacetobacter sacchari DSM 12717]
MRLGLLAVVAACLLAAPPAGAEDITIRGAAPRVTVSTLRRMAATADAIRLRDGRPTGLQLHVHAMLEPGDRPPEDANIVLAAKRGPISLFPAGGDEIVLPTDPVLRAENPDVVATLARGQDIGFRATVGLDHPPASRFTAGDAVGWMATLDRQIHRQAGFLMSAFLPDTKTVILTLPAGSELSVTEDGRTFSLVRNRSPAPYDFALQPRTYPAAAVFASTKPISGITMIFPIPLNRWKRTD